MEGAGAGVVLNNNKNSEVVVVEEEEEEVMMELPPGFRFHPTDEEIITHYLMEKVINYGFSAKAIGEVDMNKCEPWDLPKRAKMGEKEWFFFCQRDRKYPTGMRTNRATESGYWKATGKDKEIYKGKGSVNSCIIGMKKTLVFYKGRAPKGEKTNWVMHEYRLDQSASRFSSSSSSSSSYNHFPKSSKDEWVVCRVFHKNSSGGIRRDLIIPPRIMISDYSTNNFLDDIPSQLPPLMDLQPPPLPAAATSTHEYLSDDDDDDYDDGGGGGGGIGIGIGIGMELLKKSSSKLQLLQEEEEEKSNNFYDQHMLIPNVINSSAFKNSSYQDMSYYNNNNNNQNPFIMQSYYSNLRRLSSPTMIIGNINHAGVGGSTSSTSLSLSEEQEFNKNIIKLPHQDQDQEQYYCKIEKFSSNNSMVISPSQEETTAIATLAAGQHNDINTTAEISSSLIKNISDLDSLWDYRDY